MCLLMNMKIHLSGWLDSIFKYFEKGGVGLNITYVNYVQNISSINVLSTASHFSNCVYFSTWFNDQLLQLFEEYKCLEK